LLVFADQFYFFPAKRSKLRNIPIMTLMKWLQTCS